MWQALLVVILPEVVKGVAGCVQEAIKNKSAEKKAERDKMQKEIDDLKKRVEVLEKKPSTSSAAC